MTAGSPTRVVTLAEIQALLPDLDLLPPIEAGFVALSQGRSVVPPVGELLFDDPPGDVHIKYGYIRGGEHYVVKVASGFYGNPARSLPSSDGVMLLFAQQTGELRAVLLDAGQLTDLRTAVAGAIAAKYCAPRHVSRIGIVGTGVQARAQLRQLMAVTPCREVIVSGRSLEGLDSFIAQMGGEGFRVTGTHDPAEVAQGANLIVTTTPATGPLFPAGRVRPGTHVTAVGSDAGHKQELDPALLGRADLVVADSLTQCRERGEIHHALEAGALTLEEVRELGDVISGKVSGRQHEEQITVVDLTGVAVQDIAIADAVYRAALASGGGRE